MSTRSLRAIWAAHRDHDRDRYMEPCAAQVTRLHGVPFPLERDTGLQLLPRPWAGRPFKGFPLAFTVVTLNSTGQRPVLPTTE